MLSEILNTILFLAVLMLVYRLTTVEAEYRGIVSNLNLWIKEQDKTIEKMNKTIYRLKYPAKDVEI